jgi:hypothetical protein
MTTEKLNSIKELISIVANLITIVTLIWVTTYGLIKKHKNLLGFRINEFIGFILKSSILLVFGIIVFYLSYCLYLLILVFTKVNGSNVFWERGHELPHIIAYFISGAVGISLLWLLSTIIWTGSLKYVKSLWDNTKLPNLFKEFSRDKELIIDEAIYKATEDNFFNVTLIAQQMIKNNSLTITSSNSLAGDPLQYTIKNLIIKYRFGKENDPQTVVIPEYKTLTLKYNNEIEIS